MSSDSNSAAGTQPTAPGWRHAVAAGLVIGGMGSLAAASWALLHGFAAHHREILGVRLCTVGVIVIAWYLARSRAITAEWTYLHLGRRRPIPHELHAILALSGLGAVSWSLAAVIEEYPFVGSFAVAGVVGGAAVAAGALLGWSRSAAGRWHRPGLEPLLQLLTGAALVAGLAMPLAASADGWTLHTTTARQIPIASPPFPASISRVGWATTFHGTVRDPQVTVAGIGVVLLVNDGVIGVDGTTGKITGRHRFHKASPYPAEEAILTLANAAVVKVSMDGPLIGYSIVDGHRIWTARMPPPCRPSGFNPGLTHHVPDTYFTPTGMLIPTCDGSGGAHRVGYVSIDTRTGSAAWRHVVAAPDSWAPWVPAMSRDSHLLEFKVGNDARSVQRLVVDSRDGTLLLPKDLDSLATYGRGYLRDGSLADLSTGKLPAAADPVTRCGHLHDGILLQLGAVCPAQPRQGYDPVGTELALHTGQFGSTLTTLKVELGSPGYVVKTMLVVRGAVVVVARSTAAEGDTRVIGLQ